ncbi:hypothetical protein V6N13_043339 [Hibiscus sabdariffa]
MAVNWDGSGNSLSFWSCNWDVENDHFSGSGKSESIGFSEAVNDDIVDRLPADPFGMEIRSTFAAAITGWIHDVENDLGSDFCVFGMQDGEENKIADQQHLLKGLNWVWNGAMSFQQEQGNSSVFGFDSEDDDKRIDDQSSLFKGMNWVWNGTMSFQQEECNFEINEISIPNVDFSGFGIGNEISSGDFVFNDEGKRLEDDNGVSGDNSEGDAPNNALFFTLGYLGLKDLLSVERVCKSLRDAVRSDPLLWRNIHIEHSLSKRITDDALLKLTSRAQGTIECLSLEGCKMITDDGLRRVLESNPKVTKLSVPECTRLNVEGILFNLRAFKSAGFSGIKHLRIGGSFSVTEEQFKELKVLLGINNSIQSEDQKPHFFLQGQSYLMSDDDRAIDIELSCVELAFSALHVVFIVVAVLRTAIMRKHLPLICFVLIVGSKWVVLLLSTTPFTRQGMRYRTCEVGWWDWERYTEDRYTDELSNLGKRHGRMKNGVESGGVRATRVDAQLES